MSEALSDRIKRVGDLQLPLEAQLLLGEIYADVRALERDKVRLDYLQAESDDLRSFDIPTGGGDAEIGWRVVAHFMAEPCERIVGEVWHDDLRIAIDRARTADEQARRAGRALAES